MSDQVWKVPVSPAQRFILINLAHHEEQKVKGGSAGRVLRRFLRAFELVRIRASLKANENRWNPKHATSESPSLFEITAENAEQALKLADVEHGTVDEVIVGPLFDLLEDLKSGKAVESFDGVPAFDPESDDWAPQSSAADPVEDAAEKIAVMLDSQFPEAAKLVRSGVWESVALPSEKKITPIGENPVNGVTPATASA